MKLGFIILAHNQPSAIRRLAENTNAIFRWFTVEVRDTYPGLTQVIDGNYYEKNIKILIDEILDEAGAVKDSASEALAEIRMKLYRKRNELRRVFDRIVSKLNKLGHLADIEESYMNGRRGLAAVAGQQSTGKGVWQNARDRLRTSFIEPEETTELRQEHPVSQDEETKGA